MGGAAARAQCDVQGGAAFGRVHPVACRHAAEDGAELGGVGEREQAVEQRVVERGFGEPLEWERLDNCRASRITVARPDSSITAGSTGGMRAWAVDRLLKMRSTFGYVLRSTIDEAAARRRASRSTNGGDPSCING